MIFFKFKYLKQCCKYTHESETAENKKPAKCRAGKYY
jgi:hypothetical protein